jgi:hypothetical protein
VNLAIYRGGKVAMKQLLTVNQENVLRFRHECFLMKNLSHPNVVKLVGVCWDDSLFACCLEFVENGSLEDWLRRTPGGMAYKPPKKKIVKGKKGKKNKAAKAAEKGPSEAEVAFKGFNHDGQYNPGEHTELDKEKLAEGKALVDAGWNDRYNPKKGWEEMKNEDGSRLEGGVACFTKYESKIRCGMGLAYIVINAAPKQVMARFMDSRNSQVEKVGFEGNTFTSGLYFSVLPSPYPAISDRETLYRSVGDSSNPSSSSSLRSLSLALLQVAFQDDKDGYNFSGCGYSVTDERQPVGKGHVRAETLFCIVLKEVRNSDGAQTEVWRMSRVDPKFAKGLGFINSRAASLGSKYASKPLLVLKEDVERLVEEYEPPLVENDQGEQLLTWKGHLWRMALEAAVGVQYLHHHRYWSDGGTRHNGATGFEEEEEAGWKVSERARAGGTRERSESSIARGTRAREGRERNLPYRAMRPALGLSSFASARGTRPPTNHISLAQESVIHRDLKPDNMLLTREWTLKLTDFGEARAQNMGGTMTSVGTPIYIAPEVMRADHYDEKADTWSYGLCLVAMIRAERTLEQFFYQVSFPARRFTKDHL